MKLTRFGLPAPEFNGLERELDQLEPAWADFAHGIRTGMRYRRDSPAGEAMVALSYVDTRRHFDAYRERFESGDDPTALLHALKFAFSQAVPVPYWVATAVRERIDKTLDMKTDTPHSLHDAFDLASAVPLSPKRYAQAKLYLRLLPRLYAGVTGLMADTGCSLDDALRRVVRENRLGIGLTKARQVFEKQDRIQRQHLGKRPRRRSVK
ncbi:MAG: hypothetical protein U1E95_05330 [Rubrivivax sp.]|nr:hypothetical protein [Pseudomonadota bacterium]